MIQPQTLNVIPGAYEKGRSVWAIRGKSGKFLVILDPRFPGRRPIRLFTCEVGARRVMNTLIELKPAMEKQRLAVVEVGQITSLGKANAVNVPPSADSFVINNPDEVYELVTYLRSREKDNADY